MPRGVKKVVAEAAQNVVSKKVVPRRVVAYNGTRGDEPKMTSEQAVESALSTIANHASPDQTGSALALLLKAAGINAEVLARDLANDQRLHGDKQVTVQGKRSEPQNSMPPTPPLEYSLDSLANSISDAHAAIQEFTKLLQPFLQQHMFDDSLGQEAAADSDGYYAEHGSTLSPTLLSVNRAINEVNRLVTRINYVRSNIVL
jgi:hypothetical protein